MTDRATGTLSIEVETTCIIPGEADDFCYVRVEADSEYNNGKTCFAPRELAYFKVYKAQTVLVESSGGGPRIIDRGAGEVIEEYITFSNYSGSSTKPIYTRRSARWVGTPLGNIHFLQNSNQLYVVPPPSSGPGYGILKIEYETRFDRYSVTSPEEGDLVAYAYGTGVCSTTSSSVTFEFRDECDVGAQEVTVIARDAITGEAISGASVYVDGTFKGTTDSGGRLYVGTLTVGVHTIRITADGYQSTASDGLSNDRFTVSE